jgi:hypothetical protein
MKDRTNDRRCELCGAVRCAEIFDRCLAKEFEDAAFFAVHHLTVPAYALQHGHYEPEVVGAVATMMLGSVDGPPTAGTAEEMRARFSGLTRVRSRAAVTARPVTQSIATVDFSTPEAYRESVRAWAKAVARSVL